MKMLIIEDDRHLNKAIAEMMKSIADVTSVYDGEEALFVIEQNIFDLIILDLMLPGADGYQILKKLRSFSTCPVLMLTAKDSIHDKVKGLKLGADDYMTKPFYRDELIARVEAILRRYNNNFEGLYINFQDMKFDIVQKKVTIQGETLDVVGKTYDILEYLVRNKEIIIPKEQLFNRVWGFDSETVWSVVEVYVSNLRKELKKFDYHIYLKTLRNVGYMWSVKE